MLGGRGVAAGEATTEGPTRNRAAVIGRTEGVLMKSAVADRAGRQRSGGAGGGRAASDAKSDIKQPGPNTQNRAQRCVDGTQETTREASGRVVFTK